MNKLFSSFFFLTIITTAIYAENTPGDLFANQVEQEFREGKYSRFLTDLETVYQEKKEMLQEVVDFPEEIRTKLPSLIQKRNAINNELNQKLQDLTKEHKTEEVSLLIKSVLEVQNSMGDDLQLFLVENSPLAIEFNKLVAEEQLKRTLVHVLDTQRPDPSRMQKQFFAMTLAREQKWLELAEKCPKDHLLRRYIENRIQNHTKYAAASYNRHLLNALRDGKTTPQTELEQKVSDLLRTYAAKFTELAKEEITPTK